MLIIIRLSKTQGLRCFKIFTKCKKRCPLTRTWSLQLTQGSMQWFKVVSGQPKTQNPNEKRGDKKWIKSYILKLIYTLKPFKNSIAIRRPKKVWSPYNDSKMATKNGFDPPIMTKIIASHLMATQFIHYCLWWAIGFQLPHNYGDQKGFGYQTCVVNPIIHVGTTLHDYKSWPLRSNLTKVFILTKSDVHLN